MNGERKVFIALTASEKLRKSVHEWSDGMRQAFLAQWLPLPDLHITLLAPWEEKNPEALIQKLAETDFSEIDPFRVSFDRITFGPRPGEERLIWATGPSTREIVAFTDRLGKFLNRPRKRFLLHMTLARFSQESLASFPVQNLDERISWQDVIDSFVIMESVKTGEGMTYPVIARFPLGKKNPNS